MFAVTRIAAGALPALALCGLALVLAGPAHAVATVAADTTRSGGVTTQATGRSTSLSAGDGNEILLRFRVQGLGRPAARAVLRLRVTEPSPAAFAVRTIAPAFAEDGGTAFVAGTTVASRTGATAGTWAEWDVTAAVQGDGDVGLHVSGPEGLLANPASFSSREGPDAPQLVVTPDDARGARLAGLLDPRTADIYVAGARDHRNNSLDCLDVIAAPGGLGIPGRYIGVYHTLIDNVFVSKLATSDNLTTWTHRADLDTHASQPTLASLPDGGFLLAVERDVATPVAGNNLVVRHYASWAALTAGTFREVSLPRSLAPTAEGTPALNVKRWNGPDDSEIEITFHYFRNLDVDRQAAGVLTNFAAASWAPQIDAVVNDLFAGLGTRGNLGDRARTALRGPPVRDPRGAVAADELRQLALVSVRPRARRGEAAPDQPAVRLLRARQPDRARAARPRRAAGAVVLRIRVREHGRSRRRAVHRAAPRRDRSAPGAPGDPGAAASALDHGHRARARAAGGATATATAGGCGRHDRTHRADRQSRPEAPRERVAHRRVPRRGLPREDGGHGRASRRSQEEPPRGPTYSRPSRRWSPAAGRQR